MVVASSLRGWAGLGGGGRILAVAVARCDLWTQLLSLVSEEALPNKMSLSWDMLLSCDLVLMRILLTYTASLHPVNAQRLTGTTLSTPQYP